MAAERYSHSLLKYSRRPVAFEKDHYLLKMFGLAKLTFANVNATWFKEDCAKLTSLDGHLPMFDEATHFL